MGWRSFVATGDSFTEGLDDPSPDGAGYRGWADLVAQWLASRATTAARSEPVRYANLAVRGRLLGDVVGQQVPAAVGMRPDLVSFAAGGNDSLRRGFDPRDLVAQFDGAVARLRDVGADVLLFRCADYSARLPARRLLRPRIEAFNEAVSEVGARHGAKVVDLWGEEALADPRYWSPDRLHLSTAGHRLVAARVAEALGAAPDPAWLAPDVDASRPAPPAWLSARGADARWVGRHLVPWLGRRLRGRSSGDTVRPKRPTLEPV